jgi:hypothetical protein
MSYMSTTQKVTDGKVILTVDGVDKQLLDSVVKKFNFKNYAGVLQFAIAIMNATEETRIAISKDGEIAAVGPADELVNTPDDASKPKAKSKPHARKRR